MSDWQYAGSRVHERLRDSANGLFWIGVAITLVGVAAVVFPMMSTLIATLLVGWAFLLSGALMFAGALSIHGTTSALGGFLISLASVAAGAFLVFNPMAGVLALTLLIGIIFMIEGAVELAFALEIRPHPGWFGMLVSAICSIVLALVIAAGLPGVSVIVLGVLLGINFVSTGFGYVYVSRTLASGD